MAIRFVHAQFLRFLPSSGARKILAYFGRADVFDPRVGKTHKFADVALDLVHEQVLLPESAPAGLATPIQFAAAIDEVEALRTRKVEDRKRWSQIGAAFVLALPPDREVTLDEVIELTQRIARRIQGATRLPIYIAIHDPALVSPGNVNRHGHLFLPLREVDRRGFSLTKLRDVFARPRAASEQNTHSSYMAEATNWPWLSFEEQQGFFTELGIDLIVDPSAPFGNRHWTKTLMREDRERVEARRIMTKKRNLEVVYGPPAALMDHLLRGRSTMTIAETRRLVASLIDNDARGEERMDAILSDPTIVTFASHMDQVRPSRMTTREICSIINRAAELVDRERDQKRESANNDLVGRWIAVSAESSTAVLNRMRSLVERRTQPSKRLLLLGVRHSHSQSTATALENLGPTIATVAAILKPPALSRFKRVQRVKIREQDLVLVPRLEQIDDQSLARLMVVLHKANATAIFGYDESARRGIVTSRLAAYTANALDPSWDRDMSQSDIERCLRCGRVDPAVMALNDRNVLSFDSVAEQIETSPDFIVCDDSHRIAIIDAARRNGEERSPTTQHPQSSRWTPGRWIRVTKTDYSDLPPILRQNSLVQILEAPSGHNVIVGRLPNGRDHEIDLDRFPFVRAAHAISMREARHAPQSCRLLVELTRPRHAWACMLLAAVRGEGLQVRVAPSVATDIGTLITAVRSSLPAALPSELLVRSDPNADIAQIMSGPVPQNALDRLSDLGTAELELEQMPAFEEPNGAAEHLQPMASLDTEVAGKNQSREIDIIAADLNPRDSDNLGLESIPIPNPSKEVLHDIPTHLIDEKVRKIISSPDGLLTWARLRVALHPDAEDRDHVYQNLLPLCLGGPTAMLIRIAMDLPPLIETSNDSKLEEELAALELVSQMPTAWDSQDLSNFKTDIQTIWMKSSKWNEAFNARGPAPSINRK